ncbi:MAG: hypothetical protein ABJN69_16605 [Hellea sp.]
MGKDVSILKPSMTLGETQTSKGSRLILSGGFFYVHARIDARAA